MVTTKDFVENFKVYSAIVTSSAFLVCITIAIFATDNLFTSFGIDFFAKAEFGDYLILGVRKVTASITPLFTALMSVLSLRAFSIVIILIHKKLNSIDYDNKSTLELNIEKYYNPFTFMGLFIATSTIYVIVNTETLNAATIKLANPTLKVQTLTYGKNENKLPCLVFIGDIGRFSHYWSITESAVVAVNTSSIQIINTMFSAASPRYLTATAKNPIPQGIGMPPQKPRINLNSPLYDKWRNENNARIKSIKEVCNPD